MNTPYKGYLMVAVLAALATLPPVSARGPARGSEFRGAVETVAVSGLVQPVEIVVDRWGVPHLFARNEDDVFFAQGWNAARDRLFQIDLWRRRGLGELAEAFGPALVEQDRAARLFLYRGDMAREWRAYSVSGTREAERIATRFTAGINAYIDHLRAHPEQLPWEFKQLGYEPARWAAEDVVRIRSHGLTRNLLSEANRAHTACQADVQADQIRVGLQPAWETRVPAGLDPCLPGDVLKVFQLATQSVRITPEMLETQTGVGSDRLANVATAPERQLAAVEPGAEGPPDGSNGWVIAPRRSATGRAILASDPHRAYTVPSLRYLVHLAAPGFNVIGAGEPALPGISIGHNGMIAFGLTIFSIDQDDLYVYGLHPTQPGLYRYQEGWEPFKTVRETIQVKGAPPVEVELAFARHGPVIYLEPDRHRAFAVRSGWLEPGMSPYFGSLNYLRAKNFKTFQRAMRHWGAPAENQLYADVKGNIGWVPGGLAPQRPNWDGLLPVPGDGRYEWAGFWSGDQLPFVYNPAPGWFASANQMNLPPDYPYRERKLGFEWTNPSRYLRVAEVLAALPKVSLEDSQRLQNDLLSIPARRVLALLDGVNASDPQARAGLDLFANWDCRQTQDSAPAALFEVWQTRHLRKAFREAVLPKAAAAALSSTDLRVMLDLLENPGAHFGDQALQKRTALLLATLAAAYAEMEKLQGPDPKVWQWGRLHHHLSEHPVAALVDVATRGIINVGPLPKHGSEYTPNQSLYRASDFQQLVGPSFRIVVDVGHWDNSRAVNHPGQSGDPGSPHYRDLASLWLRGEYFPLLYSRAAIEKAAEARIWLVPARR